MQHRTKKEGLSVMEAVDNLTYMAEIDLNASLSQEGKAELTDQQVGEQLHSMTWHSPEYFLYNRERVKETFRVILSYLKQFYERDKGQLRDITVQRGFQAMMILANEAALKVDKYTEKLKEEKEESITKIKEYQDLMHFYQTKIIQKFHLAPESATPWEEEWENAAEGGGLDTQRQGLKDLEVVRTDREYEFFLIRKENGRPFFNKELLRHLRLVGEFDKALETRTGEDPFLRIKIMQDRDLNQSAKEILHQLAPHLDSYCKEALRHKQMAFVSDMNKAVMALMLAANSHNLLQNTTGKSCMSYYADFHFYLRKALTSAEYQRLLHHPSDQSHRFAHTLMGLCQALCNAFFMRMENRAELVAFIHLMIEKGAKNAEQETPTHSPLSIWNVLLDDDDNIRYVLKHYPNGPILRATEVFSSENQLKGFDPLAQQNVPSQIFTFSNEDMHISCLRLPSPVHQEYVNKAELALEFDGFLNTLTKGQRHLLINLQDRTSWQEHARCHLLEKKGGEGHALMVATLPKSGEFYLQSGIYISINDAKEFMALFKEQIASEEACGFHFPEECKTKEFQTFIANAMHLIHRLFFGEKEVLIHKNRLDFIEIFYLMLELKIIELCKPDSISFTCKDAIDTGAAAAAEFYSFLRMTNRSDPWNKKEKDFLLWMLYSSALSLRHRAIDYPRFSRMINALSVITGELDAHREAVIEGMRKLYAISFFKNLNVYEN